MRKAAEETILPGVRVRHQHYIVHSFVFTCMLPSTPRHSCRRLSSILQNSELLMHEPTYIKVTHSPLPIVHLETIIHYQPTISSPSASLACLARFCDFFSQTSTIDIRTKCAGDYIMMRSSSYCWMKSTVSIGCSVILGRASKREDVYVQCGSPAVQSGC